MASPGAEAEHSPDPPKAHRGTEKQKKRLSVLRGRFLCAVPLSFSLFFVVGVGESEFPEVCVKESFLIWGGRIS